MPRSWFRRWKIPITSMLVLRVEVPGRLVGEQDRRVVDQRARDRDALLLPARQLVRMVVGAVAEPDQLEHLHGALVPFGRLQSPLPP